MSGMKIIIAGESHQIIGEPSPRVLHGLYEPSMPIPVIEEAYEGQLMDMYRSNGRKLVGCVGSIYGETVIEALASVERKMTDLISRGMLLGPAVSICAAEDFKSPRMYRSLGIWALKDKAYVF